MNKIIVHLLLTKLISDEYTSIDIISYLATSMLAGGNPKKLFDLKLTEHDCRNKDTTVEKKY